MFISKSLDKRNLIKLFLLRALLIYVVWQIAYLGFIKPEGSVDTFLTNLEIKYTTFGLNLIGYQAVARGNIVYIDNLPAVRLEDVCNGLELIVLYVGFLICFPGKVKSKILYMIIGGAILFSINILREIILAINFHEFRSSFNFNHKYTYTLLTYVLVFFLWKHWLKRYSIVGNIE